ncbi:hypothetical protein ACWFRJ_23795 [Streptomyces sp. NPDC055239]
MVPERANARADPSTRGPYDHQRQYEHIKESVEDRSSMNKKELKQALGR